MLKNTCLAVKDSSESSEGKEESCRESLNLHREYLSSCEHNVGRNMDSKGHSDVSEGNEEHVIENWRKGDPCYKGAKS